MIIHRARCASALFVLRFYMLMLAAALLGGAAAVFSPGAGAFFFGSAAVLSVSAAAAAGRFCAAFSASLTGGSLCVFRGVFAERKTRLRRREIVSVLRVQTPLQRGFRVCTVVVRTYSSSAVLADISVNDARELSEALCRECDL